MLLGEQVKPEMIQSMIEVGTGICMDIKEARTDITNLRSILSTLVREKGLRLSPPALIHSHTGRTRRSSRMQDVK
jgi:gamma-glutamyl:cysteine ligase YbdK (ATP-grasp superfamily)